MKDKGSGMVTTVKAVIGRREGRMEDIKGPYEHRFLIRVAKEDYTGKIEHVNGLIDDIKAVQGLLGNDDHKGIQVREDCKDSPEHVKASELLRVSGGLSRASAFFE